MEFPLGDFADSDEENSGPSARELRIDRAFQQSKESYKNELVSLNHSWFDCKLEDVPILPATQLLGFHSLDASAHAAYLKKDYHLALSWCLAYLDGVRGGNIIVSGNSSAREKELFDIAIRSAIRSGSKDQAYHLASRALSHPTLSASIAEAFIFSGHPRDAVSSLLKSSSARSRGHPFVKLLSQAFLAWEKQISKSDEHLKASLHTLHGLLEGSVRRTAYFSKHLFPGDEPSSKPDLNNQPKPSKIEAETLQQLCTTAGLDDCESRRLVHLLTSSESNVSQTNSDDRSVRTL
ncbi:uncharacterized protein EI90DRAFT_3035108 [Cantharellus anzutake]|uniref:uncharacterized protein n=1 Tax=Cantharellus anzutake TaxID=1750568 RepID=UPI0019081276|nr:uncharacterized protein EI90DRAFT_3131793 [Cantharellus anzutake]XP_038921661.1 uncharacterized protein EI90DRAFT_3035108 [Cantharellus anzutake]KAF8320962.1 hypothetical protein EI90DRAFT_3131793 [Cantharellus anzutake]KAF8340299.1 hypothetical protein EI90DRAFT_3035108 [Cantharellus anzutake]